MIVLSDAAGNVMLDSVGEMLNGGHIELLTGNGGVIATLQLSNPAAMAAADRELEFNRIAEGDAALTGQAEFARVVAADGSEVFSCDVGTVDSDAVIKLGTTQISVGPPCGSIVSDCRCRELAALHGRLPFRPRPFPGRAPPTIPKNSRKRLCFSFGGRCLMLS